MSATITRQPVAVPQAAPFTSEVFIASDPEAAREVQQEIESRLKGCSFCDRDIFGIRLATEEALINAIKHGNQMDKGKKVRIAWQVCEERFEILISDEGPGFDPNDVPDPTDVENLERPCGRGLLLMRHYMTEVNYNGAGNAVQMMKIRNGAK